MLCIRKADPKRIDLFSVFALCFSAVAVVVMVCVVFIISSSSISISIIILLLSLLLFLSLFGGISEYCLFMKSAVI